MLLRETWVSAATGQRRASDDSLRRNGRSAIHLEPESVVSEPVLPEVRMRDLGSPFVTTPGDPGRSLIGRAVARPGGRGLSTGTALVHCGSESAQPPVGPDRTRVGAVAMNLTERTRISPEGVEHAL